MGKIKGWTKIDNRYERQLWHSKDNGVEVFLGKGKGNNYWYVWGDGSQLKGQHGIRTDAIKQAVSYMKSHPRG